MNVEGKRVLITGGSSGIGLATAQALVRKGAKIAITGRRQDLLTAAIGRLGAEGGSVDSIAADLATRQGRETTLTRAIEILGGLDVLINNAGGVRAGRLEHFSIRLG
jgi:NAD(P)-dependent dehydrogenase (short-subunit alcohol dehydrogenase family)